MVPLSWQTRLIFLRHMSEKQENGLKWSCIVPLQRTFNTEINSKCLEATARYRSRNYYWFKIQFPAFGDGRQERDSILFSLGLFLIGKSQLSRGKFPSQLFPLIVRSLSIFLVHSKHDSYKVDQIPNLATGPTPNSQIEKRHCSLSTNLRIIYLN